MVAIGVSGDQIDCPFVIELIDLERARDDGHVPFEQINEDMLAIAMHGIENRVEPRGLRALKDLDHDFLPITTG
jgi:hypothetical protein